MRRRQNGRRIAVSVVLSLGLALGSLAPGITAAEPDTVEGQDVAAGAAAETVRAEVQTEVLTGAMTESAMPDASGDFADTETGAGAGQTEEDRQEAAPGTAFPEGNVMETAEEELPEEGNAEAVAEPEDEEASVIVDDADMGTGEILPGDDLIAGIEIVAIEDSGTPDADGESGEAPAPEGGDCGVLPGTVTWALDESGTLKVSGAGDMTSWESPEQVPWAAARGEIRRIEIAEGVTSVGAYAFCGCGAAESVDIAESVSVIGEAAFSHCSGFTTVSIG